MSNIYMKGRKTPKSRASKQYGEGRVCVEPGCEQVLSKYNDRKGCFQHHKFKQPRVRGHIDPRKEE